MVKKISGDLLGDGGDLLGAYVIFVILLTPAPFLTDTKNTLIPDFLTPKNKKIMIFTSKHTNSHVFDTSLKILIPALLVVLVTNMRYALVMVATFLVMVGKKV